MTSNVRPKDMRAWIADLEAAGEACPNRQACRSSDRDGLPALSEPREGAVVREPAAWLALLGSGPGQHAPCGSRLWHKRGCSRAVRGRPHGPLHSSGQGFRCAGQGGQARAEKFDLTELPVHVAGRRDGGPVIGSGLVVSKDPDTGQRNVSFHRLQIKGAHKSGILLYPRHTWKNYLKYQERNEPMPVAIFIGHHPLYYAAAATTAAYGLDELDHRRISGRARAPRAMRDHRPRSARRCRDRAGRAHPTALPRG